MSFDDEMDLNKVNIADAPKGLVEDELNEETKLPTFQEMSDAFDSQYKMFCGMVDSLSNNSKGRLIKKLMGYPLQNDMIPLVRKEEMLPYEIGVNIRKLEVNMLLEQIRKMHEEEAKKYMTEGEESEQPDSGGPNSGS